MPSPEQGAPPPDTLAFALGPDGAGANADASVVITGDRSAFLPASATLLVADLHLGKAKAFQRRGLGVPAGSDEETLSRLAAAQRRSGASELVILGDLFHDPAVLTESERRELCRGVIRSGELLRYRGEGGATAPARGASHLIPGNHDRGVTDAARKAGMVLHTPQWEHSAGILLCHHFAEGSGPVIAGHVHPVARIRAPGERLRLPCFTVGAGVLTLPAFGTFTGGTDTAPALGLRRIAVWEGALIELD